MCISGEVRNRPKSLNCTSRWGGWFCCFGSSGRRRKPAELLLSVVRPEMDPPPPTVQTSYKVCYSRDEPGFPILVCEELPRGIAPRVSTLSALADAARSAVAGLAPGGADSSRRALVSAASWIDAMDCDARARAGIAPALTSDDFEAATSPARTPPPGDPAQTPGLTRTGRHTV